jgi:hypothetical protein
VRHSFDAEFFWIEIRLSMSLSKKQGSVFSIRSEGVASKHLWTQKLPLPRIVYEMMHV